MRDTQDILALEAEISQKDSLIDKATEELTRLEKVVGKYVEPPKEAGELS
jgi:hypothetical protein